ncbi:hypothetical protein [Bradyrhizobium sp. USDA 4473]
MLSLVASSLGDDYRYTPYLIGSIGKLAPVKPPAYPLPLAAEALRLPPVGATDNGNNCGWVIFAIIVAIAANSTGRNGLGWFVLAVIISPLLAFVLLVGMPTRTSDSGPTWMEKHEGKARTCPFCAEYIQPTAIVRKHYGRDLITEGAKPERT